MSNRIAKRYIPEGWHEVDPDVGVGYQIERDEATEDDSPVLSVAFLDDELTISLNEFGFGTHSGRTYTTSWDGKKESVAFWADEALRMARVDWGYLW